ncbi:uncharacterized protein LOC111341654 [Stylophora pistillata]|uniref:uncharacterized protein LOC111341654 n=1 Tax=Stylophora pistillata TaxID=50429 RepID=UPI000C040A27|nr:uncharacterized protein LOC111341654 [Stylophora pistillata]
MVDCHRVIKAACIILNMIMYTLLLVMNYAANNKSGILFGNKSVGQVVRKYSIEFSPAPYAFEIWKLVNAWTALWILYTLTYIFRQRVPDVLSPYFFVCFTMATVSNMAWTQFISWELIKVAIGFVFAMVVFLYASLACSFAGLYKQRYFIGRFDYWVIHTLVNNGIAAYATWVTVAALRSLALTLTYFLDIQRELSVTIALGILTLLIVVWFILENTFFREDLLYTITIYPVLIWIFVASIILNLNPVSRLNTAIMQSLLAVSCTLFIGKISLMVWKITEKCRDTRAIADLAMAEITPRFEENREQKYTDRSDNQELVD